jgi:ubiquinol-cytochrome c reductase cytochrome b subunit
MAQTPAAAVAITVGATPQHGAEIFASHGCAFCHGPQLMGTERAPKLLDARKRLSAGQIAHQIHDGGKNMPAFGEQLAPDEIQALVAFLRSKHPEKLLPRPAAAGH